MVINPITDYIENMTPQEYERLRQANEVNDDFRLLTDAIAILRKKPPVYNRDDDRIISTALARFITNEDLVEMLTQKLNELETRFSQI